MAKGGLSLTQVVWPALSSVPALFGLLGVSLLCVCSCWQGAGRTGPKQTEGCASGAQPCPRPLLCCQQSNSSAFIGLVPVQGYLFLLSELMERTFSGFS